MLVQVSKLADCDAKLESMQSSVEPVVLSRLWSALRGKQTEPSEWVRLGLPRVAEAAADMATTANCTTAFAQQKFRSKTIDGAIFSPI